MLIKYKPSYNKIAMGLLSFMEKDIKILQEIMSNYEHEENWILYLWKEEDIVGVIGVHLKEEHTVLSHVCVNPSFRNEGIGKKMFVALQNKYENNLIPNKETEEFFTSVSR